MTWGMKTVFSMLVADKNPTTHKERVCQRLYGPSVTREYVSVEAGAPFCIITAKKYKGIIPWYSVSSAAKGCLLLPEGEIPPQDAEIERFRPTRLPVRMLMNSAYLAMKQLRLPAEKVCLSVFDEQGILADLLVRFVPLARHIRVITERTDKYEQLCNTLMYSYGMSPLITKKADASVLSSTVIISYNFRQEFCSYTGILFTDSVCDAPRATVMRGEGVKLPEEYERHLPDGISRINYAAALYEKCGVLRLGDICFEKVRAQTAP